MARMFKSASLKSQIGEISFALDQNGALAALVFGGEPELRGRLGPDVAVAAARAATAACAAELRAYLDGELREFSVAVEPVIGTPFQRRVWAALRRIPFGTTWSYARLAAETGSVARAVGGANGANPISLVVPCHRVIGADGTLTGYAGGLERKRWLLRHEGVLLA